jgi:hypothetical protein
VLHICTSAHLHICCTGQRRQNSCVPTASPIEHIVGPRRIAPSTAVVLLPCDAEEKKLLAWPHEQFQVKLANPTAQPTAQHKPHLRWPMREGVWLAQSTAFSHCRRWAWLFVSRVSCRVSRRAPHPLPCPALPCPAPQPQLDQISLPHLLEICTVKAPEAPGLCGEAWPHLHEPSAGPGQRFPQKEKGKSRSNCRACRAVRAVFVQHSTVASLPLLGSASWLPGFLASCALPWALGALILSHPCGVNVR